MNEFHLQNFDKNEQSESFKTFKNRFLTTENNSDQSEKMLTEKINLTNSEKNVNQKKNDPHSEIMQKFINDLLTNFESNFSNLSLNPQVSNEKLRFNIFLTHLIGKFIFDASDNVVCKSNNTQFGGSEPKNTKQNSVEPYLIYDDLTLSIFNEFNPKKDLQICALPDKDEIEMQPIYSICKSKTSNLFGRNLNQLNQQNQNLSSLDVSKLYQCSCGYYYFVGDCGGVYFVGICPQCKLEIGGLNYKLARTELGHKNVDFPTFLKSYEKLEENSCFSYLYKIDPETEILENEKKYSNFALRGMSPFCFNFLNIITHTRYLIGLLYKPLEHKNLLEFLQVDNVNQAMKNCYKLIHDFYTNCCSIIDIGEEINFHQMIIFVNKFFKKDQIDFKIKGKN